MSDSDDSELSRAIALSLQESKKPEIIDLSTDDEHGDAQRLSKASVVQDGSSRPLGMLGFDRRKMEEERLARARKRKLSISPPPITRPPGLREDLASSATGLDNGNHGANAKKAKTNRRTVVDLLDPDTETRNPQKPEAAEPRANVVVSRQLLNSKPATVADTGRAIPRSGNGAVPGADMEYVQQPREFSNTRQGNFLAPGIHFPYGTVKKTWAFGHTRKDDIKIEEVLQKDDLELAVLSAYQWDEEWILRKLNMSRSKVICVVQAENDAQKVQIRANVPSNVKFCFPSMAGQINCMHSKLQILSHPTHLRIVVPSANLVPYDWGEEGGVMENIMFIIDLPRHLNGKQTAASELTPFGRELRNFLKAMAMEPAVIDSLSNFDFSKSAHLAFVHSIGGSHSGSTWNHTGYPGLGSAIKELGLDTKEPLEIDFVTASIGNLNDSFLKSLYLAAQGDDGLTEFNWRTSKSPQTGTELQTTKEIEKRFRIYFPSKETVSNSRGGINAGGTICFHSKWFDSATFPRSLMRDCESKRPGILMHSKMLFVRPSLQKPSGGGKKDPVPWAYIGSANLSESAWGRLVKDRSTKEPKLNIRNWECGVVMPICDPKSFSRTGEDGKNNGSMNDGFTGGPMSMEVFEGVVPVPMAVPGEKYGEKKRPWFYTER